MSHRHYCGISGHGWQCSSRKCVCICGVSMHTGDHSECAVELRDCSKHQLQECTEMAAATEEMPSKTVAIELPPAHKLRRAIRSASRPRFGAACIWCGHGYRLGQYTHAAEDAHLLKCPGFPEKGKQQIRDMQEPKREAKC